MVPKGELKARGGVGAESSEFVTVQLTRAELLSLLQTSSFWNKRYFHFHTPAAGGTRGIRLPRGRRRVCSFWSQAVHLNV